MTPSRTCIACCTLALAFLSAPLAGRAGAAPPARKGGTVKITLTGAKTAKGTFPAVCGPYFMADVKGVAKAGDGLVFEADVPDVGHLQLNSQKRSPGRAASAGLVLNAKDASWVGDAAAPNEIVFGQKLDTASVRATLKNVGRRAPPASIAIQAEFDCSK